MTELFFKTLRNKLKIMIFNSKKGSDERIYADFGYVFQTIQSNERCWCGLYTFFFHLKIECYTSSRVEERNEAIFGSSISWFTKFGVSFGDVTSTRKSQFLNRMFNFFSFLQVLCSLRLKILNVR